MFASLAGVSSCNPQHCSASCGQSCYTTPWRLALHFVSSNLHYSVQTCMTDTFLIIVILFRPLFWLWLTQYWELPRSSAALRQCLTMLLVSRCQDLPLTYTQEVAEIATCTCSSLASLGSPGPTSREGLPNPNSPLSRFLPSWLLPREAGPLKIF